MIAQPKFTWLLVWDRPHEWMGYTWARSRSPPLPLPYCFCSFYRCCQLQANCIFLGLDFSCLWGWQPSPDARWCRLKRSELGLSLRPGQIWRAPRLRKRRDEGRTSNIGPKMALHKFQGLLSHLDSIDMLILSEYCTFRQLTVLRF